MPEHKKQRKFVKLPKFPGGSEAFKDFIGKNIRYPEMALQEKVEGNVIVGYDINDNGIVQNPRIVKGLGYGCDEEAIRLVKLLQFEKVRNQGVRVKLTTKTTIRFRLPKINISYSITEQNQPVNKKPDRGSYEYTVDL